MKFRHSQLIFLAFGLFLSSCSSPIQKQINVTKNIRSVSDFGNNLLESEKDKRALSYKCLNYSIGQKDLNEMLSKGAKIVTSTKWEQAVTWGESLYKFGPFDGTCIGISYIVEGKKSLLDKYAPGQ